MIQGWRKVDLGTLLLEEEVWLMSAHDRSMSTFGLRQGRFAVIGDNTYIGSMAYNLALVELGRMIDPRAFNFDDLLAGNLKLYLAEAHLQRDPNGVGRQILLEYLFDYDIYNAQILDLVRSHDFGFQPDRLFASLITHQVALHELGHFAHSNGFRPEFRAKIKAWFARNAPDRVLDAGLCEEAFCDLLAAVNCSLAYIGEGFGRMSALKLTDWSRLAVFTTLMLRETVADAGPDAPAVRDLSNHPLILRHRCVKDLMAEMIDSAPEGACLIPLDFGSGFDELMLLLAAERATSPASTTPGTGRMARLMLVALDNRPDDPFAHIYENAIQTWVIGDGSAAIRTD